MNRSHLGGSYLSQLLNELSLKEYRDLNEVSARMAP